MEPDKFPEHQKRFFSKEVNADCKQLVELISSSCIYLNDSSVELFGYKIFGSPWTPWFYDWAFNLSEE